MIPARMRSFRERDPVAVGLFGVVPAMQDLSGQLQEIDNRRETVRSLLSGTVSLAEQIIGAIEENRATLHPALVQLRKVVDVLSRNQGNLEGALRSLAPFVVGGAEVGGSGRWFDGYLQNLVPVPVSVAPPGQTKEGAR
jgi:phospholipid/cholesterol/gamma-HCH transport system substrate-binding protein